MEDLVNNPLVPLRARKCKSCEAGVKNGISHHFKVKKYPKTNGR